MTQPVEVLAPVQIPATGCGHDVLIRDLFSRVALLEQRCAQMDTAFLLDDLGRPGYDQHRHGHKAERDARARLEGYKQDGAKKVIALAIGALALLFVLGFGQWVRIGGAP